MGHDSMNSKFYAKLSWNWDRFFKNLGLIFLKYLESGLEFELEKSRMVTRIHFSKSGIRIGTEIDSLEN